LIRHTKFRVRVTSALLCFLLIPTVFGQSGSNERRWEIEAHGSWLFSGASTSSDRGRLPPNGDLVIIRGTANLGAPIGEAVDNVHSWYFGGGAELFNSFSGNAPKIVPLDPVLSDARLICTGMERLQHRGESQQRGRDRQRDLDEGDRAHQAVVFGRFVDSQLAGFL
jgi:hypothetical protein